MSGKKHEKVPPELEPLADVLMDGDELREGILALGCKFDAFAALMKEDEAVVKSKFGTSPSKLSLLQGDKRPVPKVVVELLLKQTPEPDERGHEGKNQKEWSKFLAKQWQKVPPEKRAQVGYVEPPPESAIPAGGGQAGPSRTGLQGAAPASARPVASFSVKALARKLALILEERATLKGFTPGRVARRLARLIAGRLGKRARLELDGLKAEIRALAGSMEGHAQRQSRERVEDTAKLDELLGQTRRLFVALAYLDAQMRARAWRGYVAMSLVSAAVAALVGVCLHPRAAALPGDFAQARAGGAAEDAADGPYWTLPPILARFAGSTGQKAPPERYIPDHPLRHQKRPPCDEGMGESAQGGGCWMGSSEVKPPCGRLYRSGDKCYRPIAEDPLQPVGGDPEQERRPEDAGMPGKEPEQ